MKKYFVSAVLLSALSTGAYAESGYADRINEARSYPNKTVEAKSAEKTCSRHVDSDERSQPKTIATKNSKTNKS
ncbi:MAG: Uncharacterized protein AWU57_5164 [Marinobacter sp. T13-3]|nr:MAG: Uncharacterized protein AWU57_5164 [Marinobacter sp. T13-3]